MKKLMMLVAPIVLALGLIAPSTPAEAHAVYAGDALFGCIPDAYVASRNAKLTGNGVAQAWTFPWKAGHYDHISIEDNSPFPSNACYAFSPAQEVQSATAIRHEVWLYPGWYYVCDFDYQVDMGSSEADASTITNPVCANENVHHRVVVSHSIWQFGQEYTDRYELHH
jgi:hypothetical protein